MSVTYESLKVVLLPAITADMIRYDTELRIERISLETLTKILKEANVVESYINDPKMIETLEALSQRKIKVMRDRYRMPIVVQYRIVLISGEGFYALVKQK